MVYNKLLNLGIQPIVAKWVIEYEQTQKDRAFVSMQFWLKFILAGKKK